MALDPFTNGDLAFLQERGVPPMAWSPLGGGALLSGPDGGALRTTMARVARDRGVDLAAVAVAFLLRHPARILPVMGTNNLARIASFGDALAVELDRETWFELYAAALGHEVP
jgi:predicted oxidoreductase